MASPTRTFVPSFLKEACEGGCGTPWWRKSARDAMEITFGFLAPRLGNLGKMISKKKIFLQRNL
jgi:hypothetical protein